ncbi:UNVERIFIED_CONTAM: hypothetical protein Sradi_7142700 [Sesamum radiatum]|uniref:Reverse transcriptase Ty1/copia-type domain-containing protein n=1 Tax=Sesamum radiatum TaxID=300843 RepID=A0AAW2IZ04_SESRA
MDPPKGVRPVGCKWIYNISLADGEVTASRPGSWQKGYTQGLGVDFEEMYSLVAMPSSIRILLAIATWYDYEIWPMDVKMAFLNGFSFRKRSLWISRRVSLLLEKKQKVCHHPKVHLWPQASFLKLEHAF